MNKLLIFFAILFSYSSTAQVRKLQVEPNHSTVGFKIPIAGFSVVTGKFTDYKREIDWVDDDIESKQTIVSDSKGSKQDREVATSRRIERLLELDGTIGVVNIHAEGPGNRGPRREMVTSGVQFHTLRVLGCSHYKQPRMKYFSP